VQVQVQVQDRGCGSLGDKCVGGARPSIDRVTWFLWHTDWAGYVGLFRGVGLSGVWYLKRDLDES
jgi:hypothetical protein